MPTIAQKITPCLWFDNQAEEAAKFYVSIFPNSKLGRISRYGENNEHGPRGKVMTVDFYLDGQKFTTINGGPIFKFSEAISFVVECDSQEEIDRYWKALIADGGSEVECGWLRDKFGLSWQIVPRKLYELVDEKDQKRADRVMGALLKMKKLDLAALEKAAKG